MTTTRIITVWLDETSDNHGWIVDTDSPEGGESETLKVFPATDAGFGRAVSFAKKAGVKRGCDIRITNSVSAVTLKAGEYELDS